MCSSEDGFCLFLWCYKVVLSLSPGREHYTEYQEQCKFQASPDTISEKVWEQTMRNDNLHKINFEEFAKSLPDYSTENGNVYILCSQTFMKILPELLK
ncbi:hypothetical protein RUM43_002678, partial [Polyplax serrata]